jgi:hypothetical protein
MNVQMLCDELRNTIAEIQEVNNRLGSDESGGRQAP